MIALEKPTITHEEILKSSVSNINNINLRSRVIKELNFFKEITKEYEEKAEVGELSQITIQDNVNGEITKDEMKFLYSKMVTKNQPARKYYERLLHSSRVCPICGFGKSRTLDHYLPKSIYPAYAVNPLNLIPCCRDCNFEKRNDIPKKGEETLHPYYDVINDARWLYATVSYTNGLSFTFEIKKPQNWSLDKFDKLFYHFKVFELFDLYSTLASQEINDQVHWLRKLYKLGGDTAVKENLLEFHESVQEQNVNHWKSAMYEALAYSDWFCSTGVQSL